MAGSRRVHTTWIALAVVFTVASLGWGTYTAAGLLAFDRQEFRESFASSVAASVTTIDVDNGAGSVHIIGSDREDIVIDGDIIRGLSEPTHSERVRGDTLELDADCPAIANFCSLDYDIQVPIGISVEVHASAGGVRVSNVSGPLDLSSSGGGVRVEGAAGDLDLRSSGGGVTAIGLESEVVDASSSGGGVRLEFVTPPRTVNASSTGGGVTVEVPRTNAFYNVDASSSGGSVTVDEALRINSESDRVINVHSSGGSVTVRYPEAQ
jgi:Putative adhesin